MTAAAAASAATLNVSQLWRDTLGELGLQMTKATFNTWLRDTSVVALEGDTLVVEVHSEYAVEWLENRLYGPICRTLRVIADQPELDVRFQVGDNTAPPPTLAAGSRPPDLIVSAGANGHSNGRVNGTAVEQVLDDEEDEPEQPPTRGTRPAAAGAVQIDIHDPEPTHGFVAIPHYAQRFWRPYLGLVPFTLWEVLRSYGYYVQRYGQDWPTIDMLSESMGYGTRHTILGRAPAGGKKGIEGAVDVLQRHRLIYYWTEGEARRTRYFFKVRETLPVLSVAQLSKLSPRKREEHALYLSYYREFDVAAWENDDRETFIPEWWVPQNG